MFYWIHLYISFVVHTLQHGLSLPLPVCDTTLFYVHILAAGRVGVQTGVEVVPMHIIASVLVLRALLACRRSCRGVAVDASHVGAARLRPKRVHVGAGLAWPCQRGASACMLLQFLDGSTPGARTIGAAMYTNTDLASSRFVFSFMPSCQAFCKTLAHKRDARGTREGIQ